MPSNSSAFAIGIGIGVSVLAYIYTKAFNHSPKPTRQQIVENGGSVCQVTDGRLLEYFQFGNQESSTVLVCFHGAQTTGNLFQILHNWAVENSIHIIAPTLPGFGLTSHQNNDFVLWVNDMEQLLDKLKISGFHLLGTSLGSIYAQIFATNYSRKNQIQNICLYVGFAPASNEYDPLEGSILQPFGKLRNRPVTKRLLEMLLLIPIIQLTSKRNSDTLRSIMWQWEGVNSCTEVIYGPRSGSIANLSHSGKERRVLIVSGSEDAIAPPHNQKRLNDLIVGSHLVVYKGAHDKAIIEPKLMMEHLELILNQS